MATVETARRILSSGDVLTATNAELREILEAYVALDEAYRGAFERAAKVADAWYATSGWPTSRWTIGDEIRALAHKHPLQGEEEG